DPQACVEPKQFHDVVGYYNRFDVFRLTVDRTRQRPVTWRAGLEPPAPGGLDPGEHEAPA
ncbi:MAG TPA: carbon-nitrogen hydrolase family protein, partial [Methylomirabilota bacterium]